MHEVVLKWMRLAVSHTFGWIFSVILPCLQLLSTFLSGVGQNARYLHICFCHFSISAADLQINLWPNSGHSSWHVSFRLDMLWNTRPFSIFLSQQLHLGQSVHLSVLLKFIGLSYDETTYGTMTTALLFPGTLWSCLSSMSCGIEWACLWVSDLPRKTLWMRHQPSQASTRLPSFSNTPWASEKTWVWMAKTNQPVS